jgi:hypothetical protein
MAARLAALPWWQLAAVLGVIGVAAWFAISGLLGVLEALAPTVGAAVIVGWTYLEVRRRRQRASS